MKKESNIFELNKIDGAGSLEDSTNGSPQGISLGTRAYNRCVRCGRPHGYMRNYKICRICFRELLNAGEDPKRWAERHKNEWKWRG